ncbi:MAG TPA: hypothetical protein PKE08_00520 [Candidatus Paceibacterota bacterium]|nr:hypothetical protein [Saprospiraceae bacterium]HMP85137.1 hypothetical protein [Candidatus Paceibacterota bacterium]
MTRLDEMDFNEITIKYKSIFSNLIDNTNFYQIKKEIENIYNEYIVCVNKQFKIKGGTLGRGEIKWGRNIIWGWYIEMLIREILLKNKNIKKIDFIGGDLSHKFVYSEKEKTIDIIGKKTVEPDFLITLKNNDIFCLELKTAAVEVFSIKKGNIEQLYKETAYNDRITVIMMVDLENKLYSIENLKYFSLLQPFINQRMEGQLCYHFPSPNLEINKLLEQDFDEYLDVEIFNIENIKKLKALKKAEDINDERFIKIIKNKISIERKEQEIDIHLKEHKEKIEKIKKRCPDVSIGWDEIYKHLKI